MHDLFGTSNSPILVPLQKAKAWYYPNFLSDSEATQLMSHLASFYYWEQPSITVYGKTHKIPRQAAWVANKEVGYDYAGVQHQIQPWSSALLHVKTQIEATSNTTFNSALLNAYKNGLSKMGWHSDNESSLGPHPVIASLSLGASRRFDLRNRKNKNEVVKLSLGHGSLLLMGENVQNFYEHQASQQKRVEGKRINLTFRNVRTGLPIK